MTFSLTPGSLAVRLLLVVGALSAFSPVSPAAETGYGVVEARVPQESGASDSSRAEVLDSSGGSGLDAILDGYNAGIRRALDAIDTLKVEQEMIEPYPDGTEKRALAVLRYNRDQGMVRDEMSSDLRYPTGNYTIQSLIGPELARADYEVSLEGREEAEGRYCHRLSIVARERDADHFDGTVWVSTEDLSLVRVSGRVADPPFPVSLITLDKVFEPGPHGLSLLRRHSGEVEASLGFVRKKGVRHIFYYDYELSVRPPAVEGSERATRGGQ